MSGGVDESLSSVPAPRHWSKMPPQEISRHSQATVLELRRVQRAFDLKFGATAPPIELRAPIGGGRRHSAARDRFTEIMHALRPSARSKRVTHLVDFAALAAALDEATREVRNEAVPLLRGDANDEDAAPAMRRACAGEQARTSDASIEPRFVPSLVKGGIATASGVRTIAPVHLSSPGAPEFPARLERALTAEFRTGLGVVAAGALVLGGWATFVPLASAVTMPGSLVVESDIKKVQHPTGGTVAKIDAYDGMHVLEGERVMHLDETQVRMSYDVITDQLNQIRVRLARLEAERDGMAKIRFPPDLTARADDRPVRQMLASEEALFEARATSRANQKKLLENHMAQARSDMAGLDAQIRAENAQLASIREELAGVQTLRERQLVALQRVTTLQREAARLDGGLAQMTAATVQAAAKVDEAKLQIEQIDQLFRSDLLRDMREAQDKRAELTERAAAAHDQLDHVDIRAPVSGIVHQLAVHTVGGVVTPAETIMEIVPDADDLQVEAKLPPNQIDHVWVGQKSFVRFSAFDQQTTPQLVGKVSYVSADLTHDPRTDAAFYTVRIALAPDQRRRLGNQQLVSGMPAELFLQTGNRTMISYLTKPIADQMKRTFIEP